MHKIIFASNNRHKVEEIKQILKDEYEILTLQDAGIDIDIPEPHDTMEGNALEKSTTIFKITGTDCFAEDSGLEVEALNGEPGVFSARYSGIQGDDQGNIQKLLKNLKGIENRKARFRTVISLIEGGKNIFFEGICEGSITDRPIGQNGFGYDPIFIPKGMNKTFAECSPAEKNSVSHRKKAIDKMIQYMLQSNKKQ